MTEEVLFNQNQLAIADAFRSIVRQLEPGIMEVIQYGIPFFHHHGRCFYLNPQGRGVDIGFCRGSLLRQQEKLSGQDRKVIRLIHLESVDEINDDMKIIFKEALILNETLANI